MAAIGQLWNSAIAILLVGVVPEFNRSSQHCR